MISFTFIFILIKHLYHTNVCLMLVCMYVYFVSYQGSRQDEKIKRREVELDPQVSPEEIMSREVELGCQSWTSFAASISSTAVQWALSL